MLDWETLDVDFNPVLIQVGCALISPTANKKIEIVDKFDARININSQLPIGRTISPSTLQWWQKQDPDVAKSVFAGPGDEIQVMLHKLHTFFITTLKTGKPCFIWANGALADTFWCKHLYSMLNRLGLFTELYPFNYNQEKCFRTLIFGLKDFIYSKYKNGSKHDALSDAIWQSNILIDFINNYDQIVSEMEKLYSK